MRLVSIAKDGALELNWMWLPAFISQNHFMLKELEKAWRSKFTNAPRTDGTLDELHEFTVQWFCEKFQIPGLDEYLRGIKNVMEPRG